MAFKGGTAAAALPDSPEALYRDLPHAPDAIPGLWLHQGDILRLYAAEHVNTADLALELPTGTGKTIPGLLIADWVRRVRNSRVVYACPTRQLARQVARTAAREGVPAVVLTGSHHDWPVPDQTRYEAAEAVAITTYSTVFNSSPKLEVADLLVFDDAHAGEQYVAGQYATQVNRWEQPAAYQALVDVVAPALDGILVQRLRDDDPDPGVHREARLVVPLRHSGMTLALDRVLADLPIPLSFRFSMIRAGLQSCLVYVAHSGILVRPLVPPTGDNPVFSGARQRLYLSATLGEGGELERAFGRTGIKRLSLPPTAPAPRAGRRYFVFPELVEGADPDALAREVVALAGKALVLAPDGRTAVTQAKNLAQPGWTVMTGDTVGEDIAPFADAANAVCGLANRYDGLDLPGDACRAVVLEGKPDQDNLQERFLSRRVRAGSALAERVRTRVVQGAGRCTRGPNDWAVVVVLGAELTKYLLRPETKNALAPDLQAEIEFGVRNSRDTDHAEVLDNVRVFLAQSAAWREGAEPHLAEYRHAAAQVMPAGTDALAAAVEAEISAYAEARHGRWADAGRLAQDAARDLGKGADATRGYRALWLYLAGVWVDQAGDDTSDAGMRVTARKLVAQAEQAAAGGWIRDLPPLPDAPASPLAAPDTVAVAAIAQRLTTSVTTGKHHDKVAQMLAGLAQTEPPVYEPAVTHLGTLLGADARKPPGSGRCDSVWCWDNALWIAVEAKSDHKPTGMVPHKDVRQANDQLRLLAADRNHEPAPPDSITIIVSQRPVVDPSAAPGAEPPLHLVHPDTLIEIGNDARSAWDDMLAGRAGKSLPDLKKLVTASLARYGVMPTQVRERLTDQPIAPR